MITPRTLKAGDTVGIIATARKVSQPEVEPAVRVFESWGLKVIKGANLYSKNNQFAGNDDERAADLQFMLDHPDVRAIICARGGYGTVRIIDRLDFEGFMKSPKWIVGYSDITVLHAHIHRHCGVETLHATMPLNFPADGSESKSVTALKNVLFGESPAYSFNAVQPMRKGQARGQVIGGNLSILVNLSGTRSQADIAGKILFIEDVDEYLYHIDRMMLNLKRSGQLQPLSGLIIGGFTKMNDNTEPFGKTASDIVFEHVKEYKFPVVGGFPAGHQHENMPLIFGREAIIEVGEQANLTFINPSDPHQKPAQRLVKPALYFTGFFVLLYILYALITGNF